MVGKMKCPHAATHADVAACGHLMIKCKIATLELVYLVQPYENEWRLIGGRKLRMKDLEKNGEEKKNWERIGKERIEEIEKKKMEKLKIDVYNNFVGPEYKLPTV
ncbi:hypothetical protein Fot_42683 [Forsythia ovata]|uniref:Uncharacterized protein n=1 Tax=Forsythia ovata TaxID=205694 RepID=A0ABD1RMK3_9LAMI